MEPSPVLELTSYCGLYCKDCIPSEHSLYVQIHSLKEHLESLKMDMYASYRTPQMPVLTKYPAFWLVLSELEQLECPSPCRKGGGKKDCTIRNCNQQKKLDGCWQCPDTDSCYKLKPLLDFHPNLRKHLSLIREKGSTWTEHREKHYPW